VGSNPTPSARQSRIFSLFPFAMQRQPDPATFLGSPRLSPPSGSDAMKWMDSQVFKISCREHSAFGIGAQRVPRNPTSIVRVSH
jgi:hypothetical protein